jgi:hypothetical protein
VLIVDGGATFSLYYLLGVLNSQVAIYMRAPAADYLRGCTRRAALIWNSFAQTSGMDSCVESRRYFRQCDELRQKYSSKTHDVLCSFLIFLIGKIHRWTLDMTIHGQNEEEYLNV